MALLRIDLSPDGACRVARPALSAHLAPLPPGAPLVIVTHGMRHWPQGTGQFDPHEGLLAPHSDRRRGWRSRSLVRGLRLGTGQRLDGHGVALAWDGRGPIWPAMARARAAGAGLAALCEAVRALRPDLRLGAVTHSLGARVVVEAMLRARVRAFDRVLLLTPADHLARAAAAMEAPGGRGASVVAVQMRENWPFAMGFAAAAPGLPTLARGPEDPRWVDLRPPPEPGLRGMVAVSHWTAYLRADLWPFYRAWVTGTTALPRAGLQCTGAAENDLHGTRATATVRTSAA